MENTVKNRVTLGLDKDNCTVRPCLTVCLNTTGTNLGTGFNDDTGFFTSPDIFENKLIGLYPHGNPHIRMYNVQPLGSTNDGDLLILLCYYVV